MSRRQRNIIFAVCALLAAFFIWLDHSRIEPARRQQSQSDADQKSYDVVKYHGRTFIVVNAVDGDTIDINIPDGKYENTRIRLWGVDTPETKHPSIGVMYYGPEAAEFTKGLTLGKKVVIYLDEDNNTRGYYGRLLAYVKLADGRYLNEVLLEEGYAYADVRFQHSFYNKYKQLQAAASSGKKGLWAEVTRDQLPEWLQRMKPNLLNPP